MNLSLPLSGYNRSLSLFLFFICGFNIHMHFSVHTNILINVGEKGELERIVWLRFAALSLSLSVDCVAFVSYYIVHMHICDLHII